MSIDGVRYTEIVGHIVSNTVGRTKIVGIAPIVFLLHPIRAIARLVVIARRETSATKSVRVFGYPQRIVVVLSMEGFEIVNLATIALIIGFAPICSKRVRRLIAV